MSSRIEPRRGVALGAAFTALAVVVGGCFAALTVHGAQAAPVAGKPCPKKGQTVGSFVCKKKSGSLVWVKKQPVTSTCQVRTLQTGRVPGTNELQPGGAQLRAAVSADGLTWTRLPGSLVDQAATPSLVLGPAGVPLLYMTAHAVNGNQDGFSVAIGSADGRSWQHCQVTLKGFPANLLGVDPDVVALPGGGYRAYLTGGVGPASSGPPLIGIHYADSTDGLTWTYGGVAYQRPTSVLDSVTFQVGNTWHMYTLIDTPAVMEHATSKDGRTFTYADTRSIPMDGQPVVLSQVASVGGQSRAYGFLPRGAGIVSLVTTDGVTMQADPNRSLTLDPTLEYLFIKDPAVTKLADGSYLMVYATALR